MIEWQPGDTIVSRLDMRTTKKQLDDFTKAMEELFPGCRIVTTTGLEGIDVLRKK